MKGSHKFCLIFILCCCMGAAAQMDQYKYKRPLPQQHEQWNKLVLPNEIFGKIKHDFSDIRVLGITPGNDTITAPFLLEEASAGESTTNIPFKLINRANNNNGYYFTFETSAANTINQLDVQFKQENFDWHVTLEASQNQQQWFTLLDKYRILSINNALTHFAFTSLSFPDAKYPYYRLRINSKEVPVLQQTTLTRRQTRPGILRQYKIGSIHILQDKQRRQTHIDLSLPMPVPVSYIKIHVHDTIDYYRPLVLQYATDSFTSASGTQYGYATLASTTLNSIEKNELSFSTTVLQQLQLLIDNQDNQPLQIDSIEVKGFEQTLIVRFAQPAAYWLVYGNAKASKPEYDITHFADKLPTALNILPVGEEQSLPKSTIAAQAPLFSNKAWLWGIMIVIIIVLAGFSISMMKKAKQ